MYAWSNFQADWNKEENKWNFRAKPGDEVSQSDLGVEDDEWEALIASGAVREQEYPEAVATGEYSDSPNKYYIEQMAKAQEGMLSGDEVKELQSAGVMPEAAPEKPATPAAAKK